MESVIKEEISKFYNNQYQTQIDINSIRLEETNPDFEGDTTCVVFPFLKITKKSPEQTAHELGEYLVENISEISNFNCVKGFLNLIFSDNYWFEILKKINFNFSPNNEKIMVEYSSPNTNKPIHLGHVRNNLLGKSLSEILKFSGNEVVTVNLINDRGIHICKSMLAWQIYGNGETPQISGMKGDHLVGKYYVEFNKYYKLEINSLISKGQSEDEAKKNAPLMVKAQSMLRDWENGVPEVIDLWKTMNSWVYEGFEITYKKMGINFDKYYYESNTYLLGKSMINEGLEKGVFYQKEDNSVWIDLTNEGLDHKLLLRSDGTSVYMTQDLGTAQMKFDEFGCNKSIYVVGNEQDYHFKVLFLILKKLGKSFADGCHHLSYGMVDLPTGKIKSREGTVVDADDLMAEMLKTAKEKTEELGKTEGMSDIEKENLYYTLGMGALKFFILKVDPQKRMLFNPSESIDMQGDTGPFVQYTHSRIKSLLRLANSTNIVNTQIYPSNLVSCEKEIIVILNLFKHEILKASNLYSPSIITNYLLKLAKSFNRLYNEVPIVKEKDELSRNLRLLLCDKTAETIKIGLNLLGINAPEKM